MGKALKWFRGLLGLRKSDPSTTGPLKPKQKWRFAKSYKEKHKPTTQSYMDPDEHAVAVAAATAAVAEAAVAAAQAAVAVVKMTSSGRSYVQRTAYFNDVTGIEESECAAAIKIQAIFRGFLARKALRALRGLVKLQALVRGHIERKRTAEWIQRMQVLLRAQARARAARIQPSHLSQSSTVNLINSPTATFSPLDPTTPEKLEHSLQTKSTRFNQLQRSASRFTAIDVDSIDRFLEAQNEKTHFKLKPKSLFSSIKFALSTELPNLKEPACETQCFSPLKFSHELEESSFFSASSKAASAKKSPFTPTKSDSSRSYFSGDSEYPSYMAYTESSKAKIRSHSAPRQRPQYERSSSAKRYSMNPFGESRLTTQQFSMLHSNFIGKAYPGSGRLDKLGMPVDYSY